MKRNSRITIEVGVIIGFVFAIGGCVVMIADAVIRLALA